MIEVALYVAAYLIGGFAVFIVALFGIALIRGRNWRRRTQLSATLLPKVRAALVDFLSGKEDLEPLHQFLSISRQDFIRIMLSFQDAVAGSARDRLCALTLQLELLEEWRRQTKSKDVVKRRAAYAGIAFACAYEPCRRAVGELLVDALSDQDREVKVSVAQALARYGSPREIELVFKMAIRANLVTRVLVAGPLRTHALELAKGVVTDGLRSDNAEQILGTLEMAVTWERALPLEDLAALVGHRERRIRIEALHAMPLVAASRENESAVMQALVDEDPEVAITAAAVTGRMRIVSAVPLLARCCRGGNAALARTAAAAMVALPPQGWTTLEELAAGDDPIVSSAAAEALQRVRATGGA